MTLFWYNDLGYKYNATNTSKLKPAFKARTILIGDHTFNKPLKRTQNHFPNDIHFEWNKEI